MELLSQELQLVRARNSSPSLMTSGPVSPTCYRHQGVEGISSLAIPLLWQMRAGSRLPALSQEIRRKGKGVHLLPTPLHDNQVVGTARHAYSLGSDQPTSPPTVLVLLCCCSPKCSQVLQLGRGKGSSAFMTPGPALAPALGRGSG